MVLNSTAIPLYWWEGFSGIPMAIKRSLNRKPAYISNFGDILSPLIVSLLSKHQIKHSFASHKLLAIGSIFFALRDHDYVWGSGFLNPSHIIFANRCRDVKYLAVRGPQTRQLLIKNGIECPTVYGDPAVLLPHLVKNDIPKRHKVGIISHYSHYVELSHRYSQDNSVKIINLEQPVEIVMRELLSCEIILSTSLHGVIIGEAYGIPTLMLVNNQPLHGNIFKFTDYFNSTDREVTFANIAQLNSINKLADLALQKERPKFDPKPLLNAFPLDTSIINLSLEPQLNWSTFAPEIFPTSKLPSLKTYLGLSRVIT